MTILEKYDFYCTKVTTYYNAVFMAKNEEEREVALKKYSEYLIKKTKYLFSGSFKTK